MIEHNSVVALSDSFVTANRLETPNYLSSLGLPVRLERTYSIKDKAIFVATPYFEIIVSPRTKFVLPRSFIAPVENLNEGDYVLTPMGYQQITHNIKSDIEVPFVKLLFKRPLEVFLAEGFYLLS